MNLLSPKNDYIFKRLFAAQKHELSALINAVRGDEPPLEVIEILNPTIDATELNGKFIVLDVLARDVTGRRARYGALRCATARHPACALAARLKSTSSNCARPIA